MPVTWSDEKLILLYCPGRGSNSRPSAHRSFKHDQGVPRPFVSSPNRNLMSYPEDRHSNMIRKREYQSGSQKAKLYTDIQTDRQKAFI